MRFICILSFLLFSSQLVSAQTNSTGADYRSFYEKLGRQYFSVTPLMGVSTPNWGKEFELDISLAGPVLSLHLCKQEMKDSFTGPDYESISHGTSDRWTLDNANWAWGVGLGYEFLAGPPWIINISFAPAIEYLQSVHKARFETYYDTAATDDIVVGSRKDIRLMARIQAEVLGLDVRLGLGMGYNIEGWHEKYSDSRTYFCAGFMIGYRIYWGPTRF